MVVWRTIFTKHGEPAVWYFDARQGDARTNVKNLKAECKRDGFKFNIEGPSEIKVSSRQALAALLEAVAVVDKSHTGDASMVVNAEQDAESE